jgi:O-antigen ligase
MPTLALQKRLLTLVLFIGPATTLLILPNFSYDPINLIKLLVLSTVGFAAIGIMLGELKNSLFRIPKSVAFALSLMALGFAVSMFMSGAPFSQQVWGSFGRNTGLIAYVSLIGVMFAASSIKTGELERKVTLSLIATNIPMAIYCLVQILNLDPVGWSTFEPFGTLGNVNFLSAFLGICSTANFLISFSNLFTKYQRVGFAFLGFFNLWIISQTNSIQGFIVLASGLAIGGFLIARAKIKSNFPYLYWTYTVGCLSLLVLFILSLFERGPLSKFVYQQTLVFRFDYMKAAIEMIKERPFIGVGLDSYGDWYRAERDITSAFRTSLNRTSNTAHNVFLDVGSNSGILGLIGYSLLVLVVGYLSFKKIVSSTEINIFSIIVFSCWIGYTAQTLASINQIGLGIWGWIFTGVLLRDSQASQQSVDSKSGRIQFGRNRKSSSHLELKPLSAALGFVGLVAGFSLAVPPLHADMKYQSASVRRDLSLMMDASKMPGATAIHIGKTIEIAISNNFLFQAKEMDKLLVSRYPREIYGWQVMRTLDSPSLAEVELASSKIGSLDPNYALCLSSDPAQTIFNRLSKLNENQQIALTSYWPDRSALFPEPSQPFKVLTSELRARLLNFCS